MKIYTPPTPRDLQAWMLSTLFKLQDHFAAVSNVAVSRLVNNEFEEIDLKDSQLARLGVLIGGDALAAEMSLTELKARLWSACSSKEPLTLKQTAALQSMIEDLSADEKAWDQLKSLWAFISAEELPEYHELSRPPTFDESIALSHPPRYKVFVTVLEDCDEYDEQTGEDLYIVLPVRGAYYTDSLDHALSEIHALGQRTLDWMVEQEFHTNCHLRWVEVQQGKDRVFAIGFLWNKDPKEANLIGMDAHPFWMDSLTVNKVSQPILNAIRKAWGQVAVDRVTEKTFAADLGL
ncbi:MULTISPECIES: hypothetical protein [Pseudomonas]|uniref:hypothetical protein n=1 Tax=Pseudomonas TaxID=286 RepID=UPI000F03D473|nr:MULTISPECIES: hypothetical protein [Pseudomonas]MBD8681273.1 hypothetical protein [Pseudomonas sp. CFBP 13719]